MSAMLQRWRAVGSGSFAALVLMVACSESEPQSPTGAAGASANKGGEGGAAGVAGGAAAIPHAGGAGRADGGSAPVEIGGEGGAGAGGVGGAPSAAGVGGAAGGEGGVGVDSLGGVGNGVAGAGNEGGAPSALQPLLDDFEDKDNVLEQIEGRQGYWFTTADKQGSTIVPKPDPTGTAPLLPGTTGCHAGSVACLIVSGTTLQVDEQNLIYPYATVGFVFIQQAKAHAYDASAYRGIKLWARGDSAVRISIKTLATAAANEGGTCTGQCGNSHGLSVALINNWQEIALPFATIEQEAWSTPVAFEPSQLLGVTVMFPPGNAFSAAFDDFTFY